MRELLFLTGLTLATSGIGFLSPASAATVSVPGDYATIQAGIDAAVDGDLVLVSPGTYAENIDFQGKAITVKSSQGSGVTTIDGGGKSNGSIGVTFHRGEGRGSVIEGFTITNSETAIFYGTTDSSSSASPVIIKNTLYDNHWGINAYAHFQTDASAPYIARNVIDSNYCGIHLDGQANAYGGVNAVIRNNTIVNNSYCGIKLRMHQSLPTISSNIIASNDIGIEFSYTSLLEERKALIGYNDIWNNTSMDFRAAGSAVEMNGVQGNISQDPLFMDAVSQNYRLLPGSPSIDAGDPDAAYNDPDATRNDMGAFGGPLALADTTPPGAVTIISASPAAQTPASDNTVKIIWEQPLDEGFGVAGYSFMWDSNSTTEPDTVMDARSAVTATASDPLSDGNGHYFHIRAVDQANNWGSTTHHGPFYIDSSIPVEAVYGATILEPPTGYTSSSFYGISPSGQVAGKFSNYDAVAEKDIDRQAIVWDPVNGATLLPTLDGETVTWSNNDGQVVGYSYDASGFKRAVRWDNDGSGFSIHDLGTLHNPLPAPDGGWGDSSQARSINSQGQVTGFSDIPNDDGSFTPYHAFLYDESTGMQGLGTLMTEFPEWQNGYSVGYYISDPGLIAGLANRLRGGDWIFRPIVYGQTNGMKELGINPDYPQNEWHATVINGGGLLGGHVVADPNADPRKSRPFYWLNQGVIEPIPVAMPVEFPYGEIYGVNIHGQMVGMMWDETDLRHAFLLDITHGIRDLNKIANLNPGDILEAALEINDSGQIVGKSIVGGQERGFILDLHDRAPSVPQNLSATTISHTQIDLSWDASTDDTAVTGYRILRDGVEIATTGTLTYSDTALTPATTYAYRVSAYDGAGNESGQSSPANATTQTASFSCSGGNVIVDYDFSQQTPVLCEATGSIATQGPVNILPGADVTFQAATEIIVNRGFSVKPLSTFRAIVIP